MSEEYKQTRKHLCCLADGKIYTSFDRAVNDLNPELGEWGSPERKRHVKPFREDGQVTCGTYTYTAIEDGTPLETLLDEA